MKKLLMILLLPIFILAILTTGKCVAITDGDTIKVLINGKETKIRLYGIDTPERGQPFGKAAKQFASNYCYGKEVRLNITGTDRYGRKIAWVYVAGNKSSLNEELTKAGLAWWYEQYAPKDFNLRDAEKAAKKEKRGLWASRDAINPKIWRRMSKEERDLHR